MKIFREDGKRVEFELELRGMPRRRRNRAKAMEMAKIKPFEFEIGVKDGVINVEVLEISYQGTRLTAKVVCFLDGELVPIDDTYHFVNPPMRVPDGSYRKEQHQELGEIEVMNTKYDPSKALQIIIDQAVRGQLNNLFNKE